MASSSLRRLKKWVEGNEPEQKAWDTVAIDCLRYGSLHCVVQPSIAQIVTLLLELDVRMAAASFENAYFIRFSFVVDNNTVGSE